MDDSAVKVLLASVGASFALGFGMAWYIQTPEETVTGGAPTAGVDAGAPMVAGAAGGPLTSLGQTQAAPASPLPANASVDQLWARALLAPDKQQHGFDAEDRLRKLAQADPVAARSLLNRYSGAQTPQERALLKAVLSTVQTPDVIAFSTRLAGSSNAAERQHGFELLQSLAPDAPETRSLVRRTLASEHSPEVLVRALATLQSPAAEPEEAQMMVAQLKSLSQHADPAVRSASILQLGQWDKNGEGGALLAQALADGAPEVRQAAIFAIAQAGVRSEAAKTALMGMVNNTQESKDVRGSALQVLERFSLSKDEYARFAQSRAQMQGSPAH
ncbi:MAG: HEAT repeat domain-containing protein [Telluria sp.]